jgi:hypothetical protein
MDFEASVFRGELAFQDYAISKWFSHTYALTEPGCVEAYFSGSGASASSTILEHLSSALEDFTTQFPDLTIQSADTTSPRQSKAQEEALQRCHPFKNYNFYQQLYDVMVHIIYHQNESIEARNKVSIPSLRDVLERNRKFLEEIKEPSEDFIQRYGKKHFKCLMLTCHYFHEGFDNKKDRDRHMKRHSRPFLCPESACTMFEFGFLSNNELDKHRRQYHPEALDKLNSFLTLSKVTKSKHECDICGRQFTRPFALRNHTLSHFGQRPHSCSECGRAFTRKNDCTRHEKIHSRN